MLQALSKYLAYVLAFFGFTYLTRRQGARDEKARNVEAENEILKKQASVSVDSSDDALRLWKELDERK